MPRARRWIGPKNSAKNSSTVNVQRLPGNRTGLIRGQERRRRGNLGGGEASSLQNSLQKLRQLRFRRHAEARADGNAQFLRHLRLRDRPRTDGIGPHAASRRLRRRGARERKQSGFGRGVGRSPGVGRLGRDARDIQNHAAAARVHRGQHQAREQERAAQVDRDDAVPLLGGDLLDGLYRAVVAGVVDENSGDAEAIFRDGNDVRAIGFTGDVAGDPGGAAARFFDFRGDRAHFGLGARGNQHRGAFGGKAQRDGPADSAAAAGDNGDFSLKHHGHFQRRENG